MNTKQLREDIIAQLEEAFNTAFPSLPRSFGRVLSNTLAALLVLCYKFIEFGILQNFARTASAKETTIAGEKVIPLHEIGAREGLDPPEEATRAELNVQITVTNQTGSLPAGSQLLYSPTGVTYITTASVLLNAATVSAVVRAVSDQAGNGGAGVIGNLENGTELQFANPLPNVARAATVTGTVTTAADGETVEAYRSRLQRARRQPPQGGALTDYRRWAEAVAGIVRAYPYRDTACPGQVAVYIEATPASSGSADGIPTSAQMQAVDDALQLDSSGLASRRPVGALTSVRPITRQAYNVTITALEVADVATVQAAINAALSAYFESREPYIVGLDGDVRLDRITRTAVSALIEDVVTSAGGIFASMTLKRSGVDVVTDTLLDGSKAKLGTVSYA